MLFDLLHFVSCYLCRLLGAFQQLRRVLLGHFVLERNLDCLLEFTFYDEVDVFEGVAHVEYHAPFDAGEGFKEAANFDEHST